MTYEFPIDRTHIVMFARSLGVDDPLLERDVPAAGQVPLTFVQASEIFDPQSTLRPTPGRQWPTRRERLGEDVGSGGAAAGVLHAEQHFSYHRHPLPGEILSVSSQPGATWTKQGRRSGTLTFSETITEYRDDEGQLVITARGIGVRTERVIEGAAGDQDGE